VIYLIERFTLPPPICAVHVMLSSLHVMTKIDHADTHMLIRIRIQGKECVAAPCVTCTPCNPGYYKAAVSTEACGPCPVNTYGNNRFDQTSSGYCTECPSGAETGGRQGMISLDNCTCSIRMYLTASAGITACKLCPKGGEVSRTHTNTPSPSLFYTHTHTHTHLHTHKHTLTHKQARARYKTNTHTHTRTHSHVQVNAKTEI